MQNVVHVRGYILTFVSLYVKCDRIEKTKNDVLENLKTPKIKI